MKIGKLKESLFVDISCSDDGWYTYTYLLYSEKLFSKHYFKLTLQSEMPFYLFTDIMKVIRFEGYFFEDLINVPVDLSIGIIVVDPFSQSDESHYTKDSSYWRSIFFEEAMNKQQTFKDEYIVKYGHPDDLGLYDAYEQ